MSGARATFPPPADAASIYRGVVMHARLKPVAHRFSYEVFSLLVDLGRLKDADAASAAFSVGRFNLLSFHERDHGPRDGSSLQDHVRRIVAAAGVEPPDGRVLLLCYPRMLGFAFNPLAVYFAYRADGDLAAIVYEVRNTFGQNHTYVCPVEDGQIGPAGVRQERRKLFYVSPFNGMEMRYRFRVLPPGERVALRILESDAEGPLLAAAFHGGRSALTTASILRALARVPLLTLKVVGGIHWEALRLWAKGMRLTPRPPAPPAVSIADGVYAKSPAGSASAHETIPTGVQDMAASRS
jgi:uncharacterized protein